MHYIYKVTNTKRNKHYIGETRLEPKRRFSHHKGYINHGTYNNEKYSFYGEDGLSAYTFEVLEECSFDERFDREKFYIDKYSSLAPNGYNNAYGRSHFNNTKEHYDKVSALHKGKHLSEETKRKLSESRKGYVETEEHKEAISKGCKNFFASPDGEKAKKKMKENARGNHVRWHENRGIIKENCKWCLRDNESVTTMGDEFSPVQ